MISQDLKELIDLCLTDGILEDHEKSAIIRRAEREGADLDEVQIYLNSEMQKRNMTMADKVAKHEKERAGNRCPHCSADIPPMTKICPECGKAITGNESEGDKELLKLVDDLELSLKSLKICTADNYRSRLADVETLILKAKRLYGENKKVQGILLEIEDQKSKVVNEFSKLSEDSDIAKLIDKMNEALSEMEIQKNYGTGDDDFNDAKGEAEATLRKLETRFSHDATAQKAITLAKSKLAKLDKEAKSVSRSEKWKNIGNWMMNHKGLTAIIVIIIFYMILFLPDMLFAVKSEQVVEQINSGNLVEAQKLYDKIENSFDKSDVAKVLIPAYLKEDNITKAEQVYNSNDHDKSDQLNLFFNYYIEKDMYDKAEKYSSEHIFTGSGLYDSDDVRAYFGWLSQYVTYLCENGNIKDAQKIVRTKSVNFTDTEGEYTQDAVVKKLNTIIAAYK